MTRFQEFKKKFERAVHEAGRDLSEIELIAVSKKKPLSDIEDIFNQGHTSFGENQIQEIEKKWPLFKSEHKNISLHFLGGIQSRKVAPILNSCDVIHSIDRYKIVQIIKKYESEIQDQKKYFIQVNTGNEPQKSGVPINEADEFIENCKTDYDLKIEGLMCIPPLDEDPKEHFLNLKSISKNHKLPSLSMGMSNDFEEAIKCGSTHIRVGTLIFGQRN